MTHSPELVGAVAHMLYGDNHRMTAERLEKAVAVADQIKAAVAQPTPLERLSPGGQEIAKWAGGGMPSLNQDMELIRGALSDLGKEIAFSSGNFPVPGAAGFALFDLEGPARQLYPVYSPIRNKLPRVRGVGASKLAKLITGISGSGTGGMLAVNPAVSTNVPLAAGNVEAARGTAVNFATADRIIAYAFHALYDAVTMPSVFAGEGFMDLRALSATKLLQTAFNVEELALLMGRNSALSAPAAPTGVARAVVTGETGIVGTGAGGTNVYIKVTAVGPFGETAASAAVTVNIAAAATRVIDVTVPAVSGALAFRVYASLADTGGADPGDASRFAYGTTGYNIFTLGADGRVAAGSTSPTAETGGGTGSTNNYQGFMQFAEANGGYSKVLNAKPVGGSVSFLQDAFASLWDSVKGNPDEVWVNGRERKTISDLLLTAASLPYRIMLDPQGGAIAGTVVRQIFNEVTGKSVDLTVHPWLPVGNAVLMTYALPFPTQYGSNQAMEVSNVQDYLQLSWPMTSLRYESSIIWFGALVQYAPTFQGVIHGIAKETDAAIGRLQ